MRPTALNGDTTEFATEIVAAEARAALGPGGAGPRGRGKL